MRSPALEGVNLPTPDEVINHYALQTNRDMTHLVWFRVLAAYRLGIILEGTNARAGAGLAPRETGTILHETAVSLLEHASSLIQDNS
jgi:aminoglycoside phosphotransferase (APT) family kinase protein